MSYPFDHMIHSFGANLIKYVLDVIQSVDSSFYYLFEFVVGVLRIEDAQNLLVYHIGFNLSST